MIGIVQLVLHRQFYKVKWRDAVGINPYLIRLGWLAGCRKSHILNPHESQSPYNEWPITTKREKEEEGPLTVPPTKIPFHCGSLLQYSKAIRR